MTIAQLAAAIPAPVDAVLAAHGLLLGWLIRQHRRGERL